MQRGEEANQAVAFQPEMPDVKRREHDRQQRPEEGRCEIGEGILQQSHREFSSRREAAGNDRSLAMQIGAGPVGDVIR